jgi:hypothetical protein
MIVSLSKRRFILIGKLFLSIISIPAFAFEEEVFQGEVPEVNGVQSKGDISCFVEYVSFFNSKTRDVCTGLTWAREDGGRVEVYADHGEAIAICKDGRWVVIAADCRSNRRIR